MRPLLALILAISYTISLSSQVTIGMDEAPAEGSLLQLKQTGTTDMNSSKGLGLPRVMLTDPNNLFPMFAKDDGTATDEYIADKTTQDQVHIGLVVYNINQCLTHMGDSEGVQVWDGAEWVKLAGWTGGTVTGISGRVYKTATFGNMEWMVENLEETSYDTQSEGTGTLTPGRAGATYIPPTGPYVDELLSRYYFPSDRAYQNSDGRVPPTASDIAYDRVYYDNNKQYGIGLFYSWKAATTGIYTDVVLSTVAPPANAYSTVQGICPNGWRIPSERDFLDLEKEISDHASLYSTNPTATSWNTSYETGDASIPANDQFNRGGHGSSMKSVCPVAGYMGGAATGGYSSPNGFNLLLMGFIGITQNMTYFGTFTGLFSSSIYQTDAGSQPNLVNPWGRAFGNNGNGVRRDKQGGDQLQPIRCVKARN